MRVLIFQDKYELGGCDTPLWIGQGLEHDLCVQGTDPTDVRRRMQLQIGCYNGDFGVVFNPPVRLAEVEPAPQEFFDMWDDLDRPAIRDTIET